MNLFLRIVLLTVYLLAAASLVWPLPGAAGAWLQRATLAILAIHAVELLLFFGHVRRYRGALAASILLTLLFGLFHWKPLADAERRRELP
ncbi:MAG: DUF1145 domain-containing protein [Burkholderiales bacterium]